MTLVSIPANPVPEDVVTGTIKTPDGAELRLARSGAAGGPQGHGVRLHRPQRADRKIFRDGARPARSRLRGGDDRLARAGSFVAAPARPPQGLCPGFLDYEMDVEAFVQQVMLPDCPPPYFALAHSMGGAVMLRIAHAGKRSFDRMVLSAPMIDLSGQPYRVSDAGVSAPAAICRAGRPLHPRRRRRADRLRNPSSAIPSPAIPCATPATPRSSRRIRRSASVRRRWPGRYRFGPCTASALRLSVSDPPADPDAGRPTTPSCRPAIEEFAYHLRAGSHLVIAGSKHEILQEQDRYRAQFWAAFDAFVPGTPLFK